MRYGVLGKTGLKVSKLCFGTMSFGGDADRDTSAEMFGRCRDVGINFFDCANVYCRGLSERILGRLIKDCRDELVITSKVGFTSTSNWSADLSRQRIMQEVEGSLGRLGTDRLDVYFCHTFDASTPMDQTLRAMDDLVKQGKVRFVGVSNWAAWQIAKGRGIADKLDLATIGVLQPMYSLAKRTAEIEILPLAKAENMGVISYSPLGGGLLTGKYSRSRRDEKGRLSTNKLYAVRFGADWLYGLAEDFSAYARKINVNPVTLAVAWVMANPTVTAPIIGARSVEQLEDSLAGADYEMSSEQWREISALSPPVPVATDRDDER